MRPERIFFGVDVYEDQAVRVAFHSLQVKTRERFTIRRIVLDELQRFGIYTRDTSTLASGQLWDDISDAPMSTGHAIARFFVPHLMHYEGWAAFFDGDVLFREDVSALFALKDPQYAVQVVKHEPMPDQATKKAGQLQVSYARKNWSSVVLFNCGHPANRALNLNVLNTWPGRDLHAFKWLEDSQIGALPQAWNYLVGVTEPVPNPVALAHFTLGTPDLEGHEADPFADEWLAVLAQTRAYAGGV